MTVRPRLNGWMTGILFIRRGGALRTGRDGAGLPRCSRTRCCNIRRHGRRRTGARPRGRPARQPARSGGRGGRGGRGGAHGDARGDARGGLAHRTRRHRRGAGPGDRRPHRRHGRAPAPADSRPGGRGRPGPHRRRPHGADPVALGRGVAPRPVLRRRRRSAAGRGAHTVEKAVGAGLHLRLGDNHGAHRRLLRRPGGGVAPGRPPGTLPVRGRAGEGGRGGGRRARPGRPAPPPADRLR